MTPRYKEAQQVQQQAETKYRAKNISTIGHSQGGYQAQLLGANTQEIITLNKATRLQEFIYSSRKNLIIMTFELVVTSFHFLEVLFEEKK